MLKSQTVADWSREGQSGTSGPSSLLWCTASNGMRPDLCESPLNDVLSRDPQDIPCQTLPKAAEQALRRHLCLRFRGKRGDWPSSTSRIYVEEKKQMVKALDKPPSRRNSMRLEGKKMTMSSSLSSFVTMKTRSFFQKLDADEGFWQRTRIVEEDDRFKDARKRALGLRVVNDAAERGIALNPTLPGVHERSAAQEKYLLQFCPPPSETWGRERRGPSKKAF
ncbi:hypothetical protein GWK47_016230 [Chionoecetes opilio]|uniref:Uncharacterized protein n=1 Tax=Chionoecetes opilio TaxID=41210 RepID=A0A8J4XRU3_CHIOP|nr:hypothetical protein GWK47_016230 [Chionoecetes opilio]